MEQKPFSLIDNVDSLPLALKKFMKIDYLLYYEEARQNEAEVEAMRTNPKRIELSTTFTKEADDYDDNDEDYEDIDEDNYEAFEDEYGMKDPLYDQMFEQIQDDIQKEINEDLAREYFQPIRRPKLGKTKGKKAKEEEEEEDEEEEEYYGDEYIENEEDYETEEEYYEDDDDDYEDIQPPKKTGK